MLWKLVGLSHHLTPQWQSLNFTGDPYTQVLHLDCIAVMTMTGFIIPSIHKELGRFLSVSKPKKTTCKDEN